MKVAFLFLIYDEILHEDLWYNFFNSINPNLYTIHIHYKTQKPLKYFESYKLKDCIPTNYADITLVYAHNLLLKEALKDSEVYKTVNLSQSCIPLKPFNYIYKALLSKPESEFNEVPQKQCFPRCDSVRIPRDKIYKSSNWFSLNREDAKLCIQSLEYINLFINIVSPEEHYFITVLRLNNRSLSTTPNLAEGAMTFTNWSDMNYKYDHTQGLKTYSTITEEELLYLISAPCLFGRKFAKNCTIENTGMTLYEYFKFLILYDYK